MIFSRVSRISTAIILFLSLVSPGHSIVIRHDRDDGDYQSLGARYSTAATVLPDGAGVLIAPRWILTAAHVAKGVANRNPRVELGGREYAVERLFIHPDWSAAGSAQDVALIRLREAVEGIEPVKLYGDADEVGRVVTFVGRGDFGTGLTGPTEMDGKLRGATNAVQAVDDDWIYFIFDQGAEATELEGVSGPGDSGGPALVEIDGQMYTLGVSALAMGKPGRYGVREAYTRVSTHAEWIRSVMAGTGGEGIPPGEARRRAQFADGESRAVAVSVGGGEAKLPDTPVGRLLADYLVAYNSGDDEVMGQFLSERATVELYERRSLQEHLDFYHRLRGELFGAVKLDQVLEADEGRIVVFLRGDLGMAQFSLNVADGKLSKLQVAQVDLD